MKLRSLALTGGVLLGLTALLLFPTEVSAAVRDGIRICGSAVIPALFPFFVLTKFWLACRQVKAPSKQTERIMRRLFGVSGSCASALLLSFVGGYPVGVSTAVGLYESGSISKRDAERLLRFCNNSGPAFFVGVVGGVVLHHVRMGLLLFGIHIFSALCCGLLFAEQSEEHVRLRRLPSAAASPAAAFLGAISASCSALLQICGLILFFSALPAVCEASGLFRLALLPNSKTFQALLSGVLELSGGVVRLEGSAHAEVAAAFLMGWGGLCVHLQAMTLWQAAKLHPRGYFFSKLLHGCLSALFTQTVLLPTPAFCALSVSAIGFCLFFPQIRQKRAGNLRRDAV